MTGRHLKTLEDHKDRISQLVFSPDGTLLASADYSNDPLRLWDVTTGNLLKTLTQNPSLRGILTFSKDGKTLACQTRGGEIELWHVATKTLRTTLSGKIDSAIQELAFSPDSKMVAGTYRNGEIQVWDINTGEELFSFLTGHLAAPGVLTFSPDSKILAVRQGSAIQLWDALTYTQLPNHIDTNDRHAALVFSPDGSSVTSAKAFTFTKETRQFANETLDVFAKESVLGILSVWDTHIGDKLSDFQVGITRGEIPELSGQIRRSGKATSTMKPVIFSQDGYMIATVLNSEDATKDYRFTVLLWDVWEDPRRQLHFTLKGHTDKINALAFTPNGKMIASGSDDGTIRLWDTSTGTQVLSLASGKTNALAFSMDGKILASINNSVSIQLWDVGTGTQLTSLKAQDDSATVLAFSTDSKILASGSTDGTIRLWDISTGNELTTFKGHINQVNALSFSPAGKMLASGSIDGAIFLWGISD